MNATKKRIQEKLLSQPSCSFRYKQTRPQTISPERGEISPPPKQKEHCSYVVRSKSFPPDQLFKVTEIKQLRYFST